jgi:hypothetical protein
MKIAVTNHAVERYQERVPGASKLDAAAVRNIIRSIYMEAVEKRTTLRHPGYSNRFMAPFSAGKEQMFLAVAPNKTKFPGDLAIVNVMYDREIGKSGVASLGDKLSEEDKKRLATKTIKETRFLVRVNKKELYEAGEEDEMFRLVQGRKPTDDVEVFEKIKG